MIKLYRKIYIMSWIIQWESFKESLSIELSHPYDCCDSSLLIRATDFLKCDFKMKCLRMFVNSRISSSLQLQLHSVQLSNFKSLSSHNQKMLFLLFCNNVQARKLSLDELLLFVTDVGQIWIYLFIYRLQNKTKKTHTQHVQMGNQNEYRFPLGFILTPEG